MFALRALAMSLLNVARSRPYQRSWAVTAIRFAVALLPGIAAGWTLWWFWGNRDLSGFVEFQATFVLPVVVYLTVGLGIFVDHIVGRIGPLITWLTHLVWALIVFLAYGTFAFIVVTVAGGNPQDVFVYGLSAFAWSPLYGTAAFGLAYLVPRSFPTPKPWWENVADIQQAYRSLQVKRAALVERRRGRRHISSGE